MRFKATTALLAAGLLLAGCGDLTVDPRSTVTSGNAFNDPNTYKAFIAKLYVGLATTGQEGPAGRQDIQGIDEGFSQYVRGYWQLQELPTDEAIIGWGDPTLPELNTQGWSASNLFVGAMYARIYYQIALANQFLRETTDPKLSSRGVAGELRTRIQGYRAEARFLRALSYWHAIDLFGDVPFADENLDPAQLPEQMAREDVFDFIVQELTEIRPALAPASRGSFYGRASQGAVDMLLAKVYLNAEVYTGTPRWTEARVAAEAVIAQTAHQLDDDYREIFMADNHTSPEIVFSVPFDGNFTRTWGGMTYLVHAPVGGSNMVAADYGINGGWWGLRIRPEAVDRYEGGANGPDGRTSYFFTDQHTKEILSIGDFYHGYAAPKYTNVTSAGVPGKHEDFPDTDFPMFRLADAYLIYAEAVVRGGGGSRATALNYINLLRRRAYGDTSGDITDAEMTLQFILDERSRELLWEGHRRQDLIRFGVFSDAGVWSWKGNVPAGTTTDPWRDLYPIPANELAANPNLVQNPGY